MTTLQEAKENPDLRQRFLYTIRRPEGVSEYIYDPQGIMLFEHALWLEESEGIPMRGMSEAADDMRNGRTFACVYSPEKLYGQLRTHPVFVPDIAFEYSAQEIATKLVHHEGNHVDSLRNGLCIGNLLIDEEQLRQIDPLLFRAANEYTAMSEELAHFPDTVSPRYRTNFRMQLSQYFGIISAHKPANLLEEEIRREVFAHNTTTFMPAFMAQFSAYREEDSRQHPEAFLALASACR